MSLETAGIYIAKHDKTKLEYLVSVFGVAPLLKIVMVIGLDEMQDPSLTNISDICKDKVKQEMENSPISFTFTKLKDIIDPPIEEKIVRKNGINLPKKIVKEVEKLLCDGKEIDAYQMVCIKQKINLDDAKEKVKAIKEAM